MYSAKKKHYALLLVAALGACSSDQAEPNSHRASSRGPVYAINTQITSSDFAENTSYLVLVDSLERGELTLADALEVAGAGSLWRAPGAEELYLVRREDLTITQYQFSERSARLQERGRMGLTGAGVSSLLVEALAFDGPTRGFLFDLGSGQALELDLEAMEITASYDISPLRIEGAEMTVLGQDGFRRRGDALVGVVYGTSATYDRVAARSKLGVFDPVDGSLEVIDAPCGGLVYTVEAENGDLYFASDPWVAGIHALEPDRAPAPCMARLPAGETAFDPETTALNDATGGITGGLIPGSDGFAYVRVLDPEVFPLDADTDLLEPYSASAWSTWRMPLDQPSAATRTTRPHIAGGIKFFEVDGEVYQNESNADFAETTLVRTTGDGAPAPALKVPGVPWNVIRVR